MGMVGKKVYQDLEAEINTLKYRIEDLENEYLFWYKQIVHGKRKPAASLDNCLNRMYKIIEDVEEYRYLLRNKEQMRDKIKEQLANLKGIDGKVMYLSVVEGKTLKEIANELGYSEIWIRKVHSRHKNIGA